MTAEADLSAILDVCEATTLEQATVRGTRLGWPAAPEDRNWRTSFKRLNGGTVRVVGWRRGERGGGNWAKCPHGLRSFYGSAGPVRCPA